MNTQRLDMKKKLCKQNKKQKVVDVIIIKEEYENTVTCGPVILNILAKKLVFFGNQPQ